MWTNCSCPHLLTDRWQRWQWIAGMLIVACICLFCLPLLPSGPSALTARAAGRAWVRRLRKQLCWESWRRAELLEGDTRATRDALHPSGLHATFYCCFYCCMLLSLYWHTVYPFSTLHVIHVWFHCIIIILYFLNIDFFNILFTFCMPWQCRCTVSMPMNQLKGNDFHWMKLNGIE